MRAHDWSGGHTTAESPRQNPVDARHGLEGCYLARRGSLLDASARLGRGGTRRERVRGKVPWTLDTAWKAMLPPVADRYWMRAHDWVAGARRERVRGKIPWTLD